MTPHDFVELCRAMTELGATRVEAAGYVAMFPARGPRLAVQAAPDPEPAPEPLTPREALERQLQRELEA